MDVLEFCWVAYTETTKSTQDKSKAVDSFMVLVEMTCQLWCLGVDALGDLEKDCSEFLLK